MGSIPVRVTKENKTPFGVFFSFFWRLVRHRTQRISQRLNAHGDEPQPRPSLWEACKARVIPVQEISPGDEVAGFATLLRRFRVGSLVGRSEIPVQNPDWLDVLGIFLHVPPTCIKRGTRLGANRLTSGEKYDIIISPKIQNLTEGKNAK